VPWLRLPLPSRRRSYPAVNAPWGVALKKIELMGSDEVAAARGHFKAIFENFYLTAADAADWRLVTVAGGG